MLGTIIEKLSALLSKGAFLASFIPLLASLVANGALLAALHPPFRAWFLHRRTDAEYVFAAVIAFLIGSLIFFTLNTRLRELMEGRFWPRRLRGAFTRYEHNRLKLLNDTYTNLQRSRRVLRKAQEWTQSLKLARERLPKSRRRVYNRAGQSGSLIRELSRRRVRGELIDPEELKVAVQRLRRELRVCQLTTELDGDQVELNAVINFTEAKVQQEIIRIFNDRQFNFPYAPILAPTVLAPTAMGNIALSIRSYALSRYQLNIESFWTRLQKVMQNEPFYAVLQDAKVQLDFLVSLFWLSIVSTGAWLVSLAVFGYSLWLYLAIALAGPCVIWALYRLALQNYRAFADLMRSAVDTYRMRLLKELHLPEPGGSREEAALWQALQDRMDYAKDFNLGYRRSE